MSEESGGGEASHYPPNGTISTPPPPETTNPVPSSRTGRFTRRASLPSPLSFANPNPYPNPPPSFPQTPADLSIAAPPSRHHALNAHANEAVRRRMGRRGSVGSRPNSFDGDESKIASISLLQQSSADVFSHLTTLPPITNDASASSLDRESGGSLKQNKGGGAGMKRTGSFGLRKLGGGGHRKSLVAKTKPSLCVSLLSQTASHLAHHTVTTSQACKSLPSPWCSIGLLPVYTVYPPVFGHHGKVDRPGDRPVLKQQAMPVPAVIVPVIDRC
jgi:hypothetical protein